MSNEVYLERFHSIFQETSLVKDRPKNEVYRFTWQRTFYNPIIIRIELNDQTGTITVKKTDGVGGFGLQKVGKIIWDKTRELSQTEITSVRNEINENKFWEIINTQEPPGLDGSPWIIEGVKKGTYHFLEKESPEKGKIYNIGVHLLLLTSLPEKEPFLEIKQKKKETRMYMLAALFIVLLGLIIYRLHNKKVNLNKNPPSSEF